MLFLKNSKLKDGDGEMMRMMMMMHSYLTENLEKSNGLNGILTVFWRKWNVCLHGALTLA